MSYVYVIGNNAGPVKVGFTSNPLSRLKTIRTSTPVPIDLVACFDTGGNHHSQLEGAIHLCLRDFRRSGEWFDVLPSVAIDAIKRASGMARLPLHQIDLETADFQQTISGPKKRGPKPSGNAKKLLTLRVDPDVIEKFRATGPGWQARMNDALKAAKP